MTQNLDHLGITDLDDKHILRCRQPGGGGPLFSLLWRTTGPKGKKLPKIGDWLRIGSYVVIVEGIDPPGTVIEFPKKKSTLIITPHEPQPPKDAA